MKPILLFFVLALAASPASAILTIEITKGVEGAQPIAVVPFGTPTDEAGQPVAMPEDIAGIVGQDLARSGQFSPMARGELPARPATGDGIDFERWQQAGMDHLVVGRIQPGSGGRYQVRFQLFDVYEGEQLVGYSFNVGERALRRVGHRIADIVYEEITGRRGAFDTSIAYVTARNEDGKRRYVLAVADADGHNEQVILESPQPLMSPTWSPDGERVAYVSFEGRRSSVYIQEVATGRREKVASFEGINGAPAFSPDGNRLALTLSRDGNPEVYVLELVSRKLRRITSNYAIDTEPAWSPDGRSLVFTSDRGGSPQLYRMRVGPTGPIGRAERLTFEGNYNASADFAPDGRYLAMVHRSQGRFRIAVLDLDRGVLDVLADTRLGESPSFAPNGGMLIYASEVNGKGVLESVSADGRARQRLALERGDVREPAWSPYESLSRD